MNEVQTKIQGLRDQGWTLTALADELDVSRRGIGSWQSGERYPENAKAVLALLDVIAKKKRIPKQRRYEPGSRTRSGARD